MKKHEEGITLIQTVIAVVMIVLIASFAILNSGDTVIETRIAKTYNEMLEVKKAVFELEILGEDGMEIFSGDRLENLDDYPELVSENKPDQKYYYLDFKNNGKFLSNILELRNIENNYIVNVKDIDNIEIFSVNGVRIGNEKLYTYDEIIEKYNNLFGGR